jgi:periplasmic divalent cation tolerance protein
MSDVRLAMTTVGSAEAADKIARTLIAERLAGCVNILSGVRSVYLWEGRQEDQQEWLLLIKTVADRAPELERRLLQLHPYELPEFLTWAPDSGSPAYFDWVRTAVSRS